jgi:hypothetical protein
LRRNYEELLTKLDEQKEIEKEIIKENEEKLQEYVVKELELNEIISHKEKILKENYLNNKDQSELSKTKQAHLKIQQFCSDIQEKFAKILIQRETILIQVRKG